MRRPGQFTVAVLLAGWFAADPGGWGNAGGGKHRTPNQCIRATGVDLNVLYRVREQSVTPFCTEVDAGERWRSSVRWVTNHAYDVIPAGFDPKGLTPIQHFNAKFLGATYLIDPGTHHEQQFFVAARHVLRTGFVTNDADAFPFSTAVPPPFNPLRVGTHVVQIYFLTRADHWDGFDDGPAFDHSQSFSRES